MKYHIGLIFAGLLVILGGLFILMGLSRPIHIIIDDDVQIIHMRAATVRQVLARAEISLGAYDQVMPALDEKLGREEPISISRAKQIRVIDERRGIDISFPSTEQHPANLLLEVGIRLFPNDQVLWNGIEVEPDSILPPQVTYVIQVIPAQEITILHDHRMIKTSSAGSTLGQALWETGFILHAADYTSVPLSSSLGFVQPVEVLDAKKLEIQLGEQTLQYFTAAPTVGLAIKQAGIAIQGFDTVQPAENQPIPKDNTVFVDRVSEKILIEQTILPYASQAILDPEVELDQQRVVQAGQTGLKIKRERIRFENGEEAARFTDAEWVAVEPTDEVIGYGTQIVMRSIDTPQGPREYWRSMTAYATSYSPCRLGIEGCSYVTATGAAVEKGVIAVACSVFTTYRGQQVFVPGYGVASVQDCGGGVPWAFWIDLAYSDEDYQAWHDYVTLYFLAPVPETIPYNIP